MREKQETIAYGIKTAGIKGKITAFDFTDEEIAEFVQDEMDEDRYMAELENEWRKTQLTKSERERVFMESDPKTIYEVMRKEKERAYEDVAKRYFEAKHRGEDTKALAKEKFHRKIDYEIFTYRPKDDTTIPQYQIDQARKTPITNFIEHKRFMALCPFHGEKTPSMYLKNNFYYCFGCGEKGDAIEFIKKTRGYNFVQAVKFLI